MISKGKAGLKFRAKNKINFRKTSAKKAKTNKKRVFGQLILN